MDLEIHIFIAHRWKEGMENIYSFQAPSSAVAHPRANTPPASQWRGVWDVWRPLKLQRQALPSATKIMKRLLATKEVWRNVWWNMNLISNPIRSGQFHRENVGNVSCLSPATYCRRLSEFGICVWRTAFPSSFSPLTGGSFTSTNCWRVTARLAAPSEGVLRVTDPSWRFVSHQGQIWKPLCEKCLQQLEGSH